MTILVQMFCQEECDSLGFLTSKALVDVKRQPGRRDLWASNTKENKHGHMDDFSPLRVLTLVDLLPDESRHGNSSCSQNHTEIGSICKNHSASLIPINQLYVAMEAWTFIFTSLTAFHPLISTSELISKTKELASPQELVAVNTPMLYLSPTYSCRSHQFPFPFSHQPISQSFPLPWRGKMQTRRTAPRILAGVVEKAETGKFDVSSTRL